MSLKIRLFSDTFQAPNNTNARGSMADVSASEAGVLGVIATAITAFSTWAVAKLKAKPAHSQILTAVNKISERQEKDNERLENLKTAMQNVATKDDITRLHERLDKVDDKITRHLELHASKSL
jgi:pyruvate/oxaloacetate carboxyltransferase